IDDFGRYNAEYVTIIGSIFKDVQGPLVTLYRGGRDESTFGPHFEMRDSKLENVGRGSRNTKKASLWLHGVQDADIVGNEFIESAPFLIEHTVGDPQTDIAGNRFNEVPAPILREITSGLESTVRLSDNEGLE
ncbi:MAG: alginate lyase, partial [Pseudomonadota bacterium]